MSCKRKRNIAREKNMELMEHRAQEAAEAKDAVKKVMADAKEAVAATKAGLKVERARLRAG